MAATMPPPEPTRIEVMPDTYAAFGHPLTHPFDYVVWSIVLFSIILLVILRWSELRSWITDRLVPLIILGFGFGAGLLVTIYGGDIAFKLNLWRDAAGKVIDHTPDVSGPELLTNLLTISALIVSAGFAYLCLPVDRAEARMEAFTRRELYRDLQTESFSEWFLQAPEEKKVTPDCKILHAFLNPMRGVGGWLTTFGPEDGRAIFGEAWTKYSKFVDRHLDDGLVRVSCVGLGVAMMQGLICLFYRYFSVNDWIFHPVEFGTIITLTILDFSLAALFVSLVVGVHRGEREIRNRVINAVQNLTPELQALIRKKQRERIEAAQNEAKSLLNQSKTRTAKNTK
jgi:hypothetical protein